MRKVLYKKWNEPIMDRFMMNVIKQGYWDKDFIHEGYFHEWGIALTSPDVVSVALIETKEGLVEEVLPGYLKFIDPPAYLVDFSGAGDALKEVITGL